MTSFYSILLTSPIPEIQRTWRKLQVCKHKHKLTNLFNTHNPLYGDSPLKIQSMLTFDFFLTPFILDPQEKTTVTDRLVTFGRELFCMRGTRLTSSGNPHTCLNNCGCAGLSGKVRLDCLATFAV